NDAVLRITVKQDGARGIGAASKRVPNAAVVDCDSVAGSLSDAREFGLARIRVHGAVVTAAIAVVPGDLGCPRKGGIAVEFVNGAIFQCEVIALNVECFEWRSAVPRSKIGILQTKPPEKIDDIIADHDQRGGYARCALPFRGVENVVLYWREDECGPLAAGQREGNISPAAGTE